MSQNKIVPQICRVSDDRLVIHQFRLSDISSLNLEIVARIFEIISDVVRLRRGDLASF